MRVFLELAAQFEAADDGHHHVADDDVGSKRGDQSEGFRSVWGAKNFVTLEFQEFNEEVEYSRIVIDNQYSAPL